MTKKDRPLLKAFRDALIVSSDSPLVSVAEHRQELSWREAGQLSVFVAALGLGCFGLHYLVFGTAKGEPPRAVLIMIFSLMVLGPSGVFRWKDRLRYLAAYASAMTVIGLLLRFVVRDPVAFSPAYLVGQALLVIVLWTAYDWNEKLRARAKARKAVEPGRIAE